MTKIELQNKLKEMEVPFPEDATIQQLRTLYFSILKSNKLPNEPKSTEPEEFIEDRSEKNNNDLTGFEVIAAHVKAIQTNNVFNSEEIKTLKLYIIGVLVISIALSATIFLIFRKKL